MMVFMNYKFTKSYTTIMPLQIKIYIVKSMKSKKHPTNNKINIFKAKNNTFVMIYMIYRQKIYNHFIQL